MMSKNCPHCKSAMIRLYGTEFDFQDYCEECNLMDIVQDGCVGYEFKLDGYVLKKSGDVMSSAEKRELSQLILKMFSLGTTPTAGLTGTVKKCLSMVAMLHKVWELIGLPESELVEEMEGLTAEILKEME